MIFFFLFLEFFFFFFVPVLLSFLRKNGLKKVKGYFVSDSDFYNRWIGAYSGSELWGVLLDHFYEFKAPIIILFILFILFF